MIHLSFPEKYDLNHTFSCGQIFRFNTENQGASYIGPLDDRIIEISQISPQVLKIESNLTENLLVRVHDFFRISDDYMQMIKEISIDPTMEKIIQSTFGLHLVKQPKFECILAFMLSQCSNIPRITHHLQQLASNYGKKVKYKGKEYFLFPKLEDLMHLSIEDYQTLGFGYRSKYIYTLIQDYPDFLKSNISNSTELNNQLKSIYGIGQKVADCIQLFAFGDLNWFPVDIWMKKFMLKHYLEDAKLSNTKIASFGRNLFGKWAGYAQEFIYHYARCFDTN